MLTEQAKESGKPANVIEKMVEGRLRKFYEEVVLLAQAFVHDPDTTVAKAACRHREERPARRSRSPASIASRSARASTGSSEEAA